MLAIAHDKMGELAADMVRVAADAFVSDDLARGTKRFDMPIWDGAALSTKTVKLSGENRFTTRQQGRAVMVALTLEVEL